MARRIVAVVLPALLALIGAPASAAWIPPTHPAVPKSMTLAHERYGQSAALLPDK